ncbi:MAG: dockerin type I domain-containing protein, partial [Rubripirellula sp.]|nr:dockerin type I domain-containing protein [Rubripirellula sp.]
MCIQVWASRWQANRVHTFASQTCTRGLDNDLSTPGDNGTFTRTFDVVVNPVNDRPTLTGINSLRIDKDAEERSVNISGVTAGGGESQPLRVTASSDDIGLIPNPSVIYNSADSSGTLKFTSLADQSGVATITVTVEDGALDGDLVTEADNLTYSRSFQVVIDAVNDLPLIDPIGNRSLDLNAVQQSIALSGILAGGGENQPLKVTAFSSDETVISITGVNYASAQSAGQLSITTQPDTIGVSVITVTVEDGGLDNDLSTIDDNAIAETSFEVSVGVSSFFHSGDTLVSFVRPAGQTITVSGDESILILELAEGVWFGDDTAVASGNGNRSLRVNDRNLSRFELIGKPDQAIEFDHPQGWRMADWDPQSEPNFRPIKSSDDATRLLYVNWAQPWQNLLQHSDVNNDGAVTALDALQVINELGR